MEFRTITEGEFDAFFVALSNAFGEALPDEEETAADRQLAELDRTFAAFDDGRIVGCAAVLSQQMVVPGGGTVPTAGVTMVGVLPTHRRRGILRELMDRMLTQAVERGEPVATLFASQAAIYGRFGYASTAGHLAFDIALDRISWAVEPPAGRVRLVPREEALPIMQAIYDRAIRQRAGGIVQDADVFPIAFREPAKREEKPFYAIRENAAGEPDAFAIYRNKHRWPRGLPSVVLKVQRLVATSPDGSQAIWRFLFDVDLVSRVTAYGRPVDDPLLLQVQEPRALRPELDDGLFLRTLDLPAAWHARRYAADGTVTLAVDDPVRPESGGTFELRVEDGAATCRRIDATPDVSCTIHASGATYLGGTTWGAMAAAGLADERVPGALERLDAMFQTQLAPWPIVYF
jgi:predicted acetyltransferase